MVSKAIMEDMVGDPSLREAVEVSEDYWENVESYPLLSQWTPAEARAFLDDRFALGPSREASVVIDNLAEGLRKGTLHLQHPCYYGLFNPSVTPVSAAADLLSAAFNPQLAAWSHGGFANEAEFHVLSYFAAQMGLPEGTTGFFTSGGQEANQSALLCALTHQLPGFAEDGVTCRPAVYVSAEAHHSFHKAAKACGLGTRAIREIPVDDRLQMIPSALEHQIETDLREGFVPVMAVATVGTTGAGAIDPIKPVTEICRRRKIWIHADAAWAAAVCLSPTHRGLIDGLDTVDSVTWDAHKWLQVPMGSGMFFCRLPEVVGKAFSVGTSYMPSSVPGATDGYDTSPQWSRRAIGLKVLAQVATMGATGLADMIDEMTHIGGYIRFKLAQAGWVVLNDTPLPLVCFSHPSIEEGQASLDQVLENLYRRSRCWVSIYRSSNGRRSLRACVTNRLTKERHVDTLVDELKFALESINVNSQ